MKLDDRTLSVFAVGFYDSSVLSELYTFLIYTILYTYNLLKSYTVIKKLAYKYR